MAGTGLIALLDDIATIADDVATLTVAAAKKTSGVVTDDLAVTAEQTTGLRRDREIPVVLAVAWGSLRNKALFLAPGALVLSAVAPWAIVPLLMLGGAFLCYEGVEKLLHRVLHADDAHDGGGDTPADPDAYEQVRVQGAIRTDFVLSAEIIAITLGMVAEYDLLTQVAVLYAVSLLLTAAVYGLVALLVRLDDFGAALVLRKGAQATFGHFVLRATPVLLHAISWIGLVAMLMVGGHLLREHIPPVEAFVHHGLEGLGAVAGLVGALIDIVGGAIVGLVVVGVVTAVRRGLARG